VALGANASGSGRDLDLAKPETRRNNMVKWWMATARDAGYEKLSD
jgi:hypothetical protein